jgi:hypothetical protein
VSNGRSGVVLLVVVVPAVPLVPDPRASRHWPMDLLVRSAHLVRLRITHGGRRRLIPGPGEDQRPANTC